MHIGNYDLTRERVLMAEIGNNHEGDAEKALEMTSAAIEAGADAIKVQLINPVRLINRSQRERIEQLTRFCLPMDVYAKMASLVHAHNKLFVASAFDVDSLEAILPLVDAVKIASGDLTFTPLLIKAANSGKPIILSTGMATLDEIHTAVRTITTHRSIEESPASYLALLHCVSLYPAPLNVVNLKAISTLHDEFELITGFSDHTLGIEASIISLSLGARVIEKHFTMDKTRTSFRDHALSADPDDLRRLAVIMHEFDQILGNGEKAISSAELEMSRAARRSIVAVRDLPAGATLKLEDLDYVRPQAGLSPLDVDRVLGRTLSVPLTAHELILETHLK